MRVTNKKISKWQKLKNEFYLAHETCVQIPPREYGDS